VSEELVPGVLPGLELTPDEKASAGPGALDDFALAVALGRTHRSTLKHAKGKLPSGCYPEGL
jgi:hypothetical protein